MDWQPEVHVLYEKIVAQIPEMFRAAVQPLLYETAQKKCVDRNAGYVNEADLITALFDITPEPFKATSIDNLKALGVDVNRYIELQDIKERYRLSWERFGKAFHPSNKHFAMYVTDRCNQKCLHCAADSKQYRPELPTEQWIQIIENLETSLRKEGKQGVYIWFGGEPTCHPHLRDLIKYCGEKEYYQAMITNGVLFDEDMAQYCADNGMSHVFISFDSADPQKNDRLRGHPRSLEYAERAVRNVLKYGMFACASMTVMRQNIDELEEMEALAQKWGATPYFRAVVKQRNAALNWDTIGLTQADYQRLYEFKYRHVIDTIRQGKGAELPLFSLFEMVPFMEQLLNDKELTALEWGVGCQACRIFNGIDVNGDIFPCGYPSQLILGNALKDSFEDIMNSQLYKDIRDRKRIGKCGACHHLELCGGGCRVHAECDTGNFFESFSYCWHDNNHQPEHLVPAARIQQPSQ
jgi:radical SAM protein with 4Fe4S-binding SPASM domain